MKRITLLLILFFKCSIAFSVQLFDLSGNYHALVIGNAAYEDPEKVWLPLKTAVDDAKSITETLRSKYMFNNVILLENANRSQILNAMLELQEKIKADDSVLIYYAGHGHLDDDDISYWIPVDAKGNDRSTFLHQSVIVSEVRRISTKAKHTLLMF